jgi:hypothetical protein
MTSQIDLLILPYEGITIKDKDTSIHLKLGMKQSEIKNLLIKKFPEGKYEPLPYAYETVNVFDVFEFSGLMIKLLFNLKTEYFVFTEFFFDKNFSHYNSETHMQMYYNDVAFIGKNLGCLLNDLEKFKLTYWSIDNYMFRTDAGFFIYIDEQDPEVEFPDDDSHDIASLLQCSVLGSSVYTKEWINSQDYGDLTLFDRTKKRLYD